ncbi:MAG TPA: aminotransferase class I/II-fold pyridoxal phosphate-dependent enzyme, partial [Tepidisphaeraceae bacterium]|nr:aminotransferase class I/II-fold pyridoxal phosphate-dependent enzyme [Tepidisphaeraceae bacterium]
MAESQAHDWEWDFADRLEALRSVDRLRRRRCVEPIDATHVRIDGRVYVDFSSNDYLGLSHHPTVIAAWKTAADRWGVGSGASPLISGHGPAHASAERAIAQWKRTAAAILLPSGFQANVAAIQTLAAAAGAFPVSDAPWSARRVPQVGGAPQTG